MRNDKLILIDLENVDFDYVIEKIKYLENYVAYGFCDFTIKNKFDGELFYKYKINAIQTFHQKNKKNTADFVLLRYAYEQIFTNLNLRQIYLFSGDGDFADFIIYTKNKGFDIFIYSSNQISSNLVNNNELLEPSIDSKKELTIPKSELIQIVKEEYSKIQQAPNQNALFDNIKKRIPNSNNKNISEIFTFVKNCEKIEDVLIYCNLLTQEDKKKIIIRDICKKYQKSNTNIIWSEIRKAFNNQYTKICDVFPDKNIKNMKGLIEYAKS